MRFTSTHGSKETKETQAFQDSPGCQAEQGLLGEMAIQVCPAPKAPRYVYFQTWNTHFISGSAKNEETNDLNRSYVFSFGW